MKNIRNNQSELKNIITEIKISLSGIKGRPVHAEECISDLEDGIMENTQVNSKKRKKSKRIDSEIS